jgi:hypothetical protein
VGLSRSRQRDEVALAVCAHGSELGERHRVVAVNL